MSEGVLYWLDSGRDLDRFISMPTSTSGLHTAKGHLAVLSFLSSFGSLLLVLLDTRSLSLLQSARSTTVNAGFPYHTSTTGALREPTAPSTLTTHGNFCCPVVVHLLIVVLVIIAPPSLFPHLHLYN